jgi:hypothetical protein
MPITTIKSEEQYHNAVRLPSFPPLYLLLYLPALSFQIKDSESVAAIQFVAPWEESWCVFLLFAPTFLAGIDTDRFLRRVARPSLPSSPTTRTTSAGTRE